MDRKNHNGDRESESIARSITRSGEVQEGSDQSLAATLRRLLEESGKSIYQLSNASGVDGTYIWRIMRGERRNVSREVLILLGAALALESDEADKMVDLASELLDAAGFKGLH